MLHSLLLAAGAFSVSFAAMWIWIEMMERLSKVLGVQLRARRKDADSSMFSPDLLAW